MGKMPEAQNVLIPPRTRNGPAYLYIISMFCTRKLNRDNDITLQFSEKNNNNKTLKLDINDKHLSWVEGAGRKKSVRMVMLMISRFTYLKF